MIGSTRTIATVLAASTSLLLAQGWLGNPQLPVYDGKNKPPLSLPDAYATAIGRIGPATNRLYCVNASCLDMTNQLSTGWLFDFSNTNGQRATVKVLFNSEVYIDAKSASLLK